MMNNLCLSNSAMGESTQTNTVKVLDLLPSLSAKACPITIIKENRSALTKRTSYSANLKERVSLQFPKYIKESSFTFQHRHTNIIRSAYSTETDVYHRDKNKDISYNECVDETINSLGSLILRDDQDHTDDDIPDARKSMPYYTDTDTEDIHKDSFKECQQIFMKIQRKLNNKMSRTSTTSITGGMNCGDLFQKQKINSKVFFNYKHATRHKHKSCNKCKNQSHKHKCHLHIKKENTQQLEQRRIQKINTKHDMHGDVQQIPQKNILKKTPREMENNSVNIVPSLYRKVYYSERQSDNIGNIPCVPPCTPNDLFLNGIASLSDIKSQRNIQQKLQDIKNRQLKKEKEILQVAKIKEAHAKLEQKRSLMETQRRQIYAINKVLANIECENFLKFKAETQGVPV